MRIDENATKCVGKMTYDQTQTISSMTICITYP